MTHLTSDDESRGSDLIEARVVYLDWNVMEEVINGEHRDLAASLARVRQLSGAFVPFSREHVVEATRGIESASDEIRAQIDVQMRGMSDLTDNCYLWRDRTTGRLRVDSWTPWEVYDWGVREQSWEQSWERTGNEQLDGLRSSVQQLANVAMQAIRLAVQTIGSKKVAIDDLLRKLDALDAVEDPVARLLRGNELQHEAIMRASRLLDEYGLNPNELNNVLVEQVFGEIDGLLFAALGGDGGSSGVRVGGGVDCVADHVGGGRGVSGGTDGSARCIVVGIAGSGVGGERGGTYLAHRYLSTHPGPRRFDGLPRAVVPGVLPLEQRQHTHGTGCGHQHLGPVVG